MAIFCAAQSIDCNPDAQFRCTVHAGTCLPQPNLSETTRAIFASSAVGIIQPRMTSSNSAGSNDCLASNCRPELTAKSEAVKGPGMPRALRNGVRLPSTIKTALLDFPAAGFLFAITPSPYRVLKLPNHRSTILLDSIFILYSNYLKCTEIRLFIV